MAETKNVTKQEPKNNVVKEQKPKVEKKQNGIIVNCACTPLRTEADPNAKTKWYLNENCDLVVDHSKSTSDFYKVETTVGSGFVKKEYIKLI